MVMHARIVVVALALAMTPCAILHAQSPQPQPQPTPPKFSQLKPGAAIESPMRLVVLPNVAPNRFAWVDDGGTTVLRVESVAGAGSLGVPLSASRETGARLEWRWKVDRALENADMRTKAGDDFAARLYVFFDVPLDTLPFLDRQKIRLARWAAKGEVPTAALCYVWDNRQAIGHSAWSPYTTRVRMVVLRNGADVGAWRNESRDVAADFKAAFGFDMPAITGVALGADTDNTGERATVWFGDVAFTR
jgi:hypothetical protein